MNEEIVLYGLPSSQPFDPSLFWCDIAWVDDGDGNRELNAAFMTPDGTLGDLVDRVRVKAYAKRVVRRCSPLSCFMCDRVCMIALYLGL